MNKEQLKVLLDSIGAFVMVLDSERRVLLTNFYALTGLPELKGQPPLGKLIRCSRYVDDPTDADTSVYSNCPDCPDCPDCRLRRAINDTLEHHDRINHTEATVSIHTSYGIQRYDASVTAKYIRYDDQDCVLLTLFDITTIKDYAEELRHARNQAEQSDRMKTKFLQSMSHEIRTPLNAIVGFSELLTCTDDPEEKQQYIDIINTNNELLLKIISDVLDMAKIETGNMEVNIKPTEISSLIKLCENSARLKLQPGVTLNSVLGANECVAATDSTLLGQVIMNLLINACKFTPKGAITFGYEEYEDELYFFVKDTGIGITPEFKDRLFDLFEKDDDFTQGLGLGLPIANAIVKKLGGNIGVESRGSGRGATFWFTIPYKPAESEAADMGAGATTATDAAAAPASEPGRITILVAEDNDSNYLLFQSILKKKYDVVRANDGLEAVEMFSKVNPDLILMDINMPNMDGYEATREIRKLSATVPIIAVTAYAFVTDRQRILQNGFNGYVSKPINMGRLDQEINNCLGTKS